MSPNDPEFLPSSATPEFLPRTIPVIEEVAHIEKEVVETGTVTVRKTVHNETQTVNVPTKHEQVSVEHVPVNQYVEVIPPVRHEGDTMIIPVFREEVVVTTRILLVEEVHVRKQVVTTNTAHQVELRREVVTAERVAAPAPGPAGPAAATPGAPTSSLPS
ncbi:YsnF/AvaK domain-containing protein [Hymenobacter sp. BT770]|uniref:YsnF/AvaK domain-containing protein n=1 Tax=Hymenobacter sp. BT770 TaxID=2886942 RepID=UPI001D100A3C|nr:YsnF/AvaK domain-containing protein [Hymenobacter sp. BT770]MCC3152267.1 YsnF/AvaK domain-containing protein [Hymenobacter sp. BT770]MDO3414080.1 YsnF/AvaK domain-containing protein [Hymenobacter sp. BT770]